MGRKTIKSILVLTAMLFLKACYYDAENELYPNVTCETDAMSYQNDISPIITQNCFACHRNNSTVTTVSLEGYENLNIYVESGSLVGTINHDVGYSPMPQGLSKMTECNISKIESWIAQGALNN